MREFQSRSGTWKRKNSAPTARSGFFWTSCGPCWVKRAGGVRHQFTSHSSANPLHEIFGQTTYDVTSIWWRDLVHRIIQGVSKPMSQTFPGYSPPLSKKFLSTWVQKWTDSEISTYVHMLVPVWVLHKRFKVLTICRNTSVETSHHGFPDGFQLTWSVPDGIKCSYDAFS